jgi:calcineurin-like phosphoesterase family protein
MNAFLQQPNLSTFQIEITHKQVNEVVNCISSLINFISGSAFSFEGFSPEVFFHVVDQLEIIEFEDILFQLYSVPTKFKEAMSFLQFKFAPSVQIHFQKSIEIVSSKLYKYSIIFYHYI